MMQHKQKLAISADPERSSPSSASVVGAMVGAVGSKVGCIVVGDADTPFTT